MTSTQYLKLKYILARFLALVGVLVLWPLLGILYIIVSIDTRSQGVFVQKRIGQYGRPFYIYKFKTIRDASRVISPIGRVFRKTKLDELPQLFNILKGEMSFIGPRPDVPGYYDHLVGAERKVLNLKPGLLSLASLKYRNEEAVLAEQRDPLAYNDQVLFPDKVSMNLDYYNKVSLKEDFKIILLTLDVFFNKKR